VNEAYFAKRDTAGSSSQPVYSTLTAEDKQKLRDLGFVFECKVRKTFDDRATEWSAFKAETGLDQTLRRKSHNLVGLGGLYH